MAFKSSAVTHVGMVRKVNQDSFAERTDIGVWVVADGMGGHEAGELAIPLRAGIIQRDHIKADLFQLCGGTKPGRIRAEEITLFKSVGHALEDLVAAKLVARFRG